MEYLEIRKIDDALEVHGLPTGSAFLVKLSCPVAKRLAGLALHRSDLTFAKESLEQINSCPTEFIKQALWRSAIVHFGKCFGASSARFQLSIRALYKQSDALEVFNYFKSLRNKHIVHDENPMTQSMPCAALNSGEKDYKVERIFTLSVEGESLEQSNYSNLLLLIEQALSWVIREYDTVCQELTKMLELQTYDSLKALPGVTYAAPSAEEVHVKRAP